MTRLITLVKRMQQSFRLMVGVPDYATYVSHMQEQHPDLEPMDEKTFFATASMRATRVMAGA